MASDSLHVEVKYQDGEINPMEFLTMIYGNIKMLQQDGEDRRAGLRDHRYGCPDGF